MESRSLNCSERTTWRHAYRRGTLMHTPYAGTYAGSHKVATDDDLDLSDVQHRALIAAVEDGLITATRGLDDDVRYFRASSVKILVAHKLLQPFLYRCELWYRPTRKGEEFCKNLSKGKQ